MSFYVLSFVLYCGGGDGGVGGGGGVGWWKEL